MIGAVRGGLVGLLGEVCRLLEENIWDSNTVVTVGGGSMFTLDMGPM